MGMFDCVRSAVKNIKNIKYSFLLFLFRGPDGTFFEVVVFPAKLTFPTE